MSAQTITVSVEISAPITKVWEMWTKPEHITGWAFAQDDWHAPKASNDPVTGGKFSTTFAAKDGSVSFDFAGVYTEVRENEYIEYVIGEIEEYKEIPAGRKVQVMFEQMGDKVKITETFDMEETHTEEQQRTGWQAIMDNFKKYVETH